jgi:multiple antibiotic resistance protein
MHFSLADILTITFTLFAVIDVIGAMPLILNLKKKKVHFKPMTVTLFAGFLIILFLFLGERLLGIMGVDVQSFAVAGSIIIFILGLELVLGINLFKTDPDIGKSGSIVPLGFPMIAGSGTLTTVMSLRSVYTIENILIGVLINLLIVFVVLMSVNWLEEKIGKSVLAAMKKFFGVILIVISVKIFISAVYMIKIPQ